MPRRGNHVPIFRKCCGSQTFFGLAQGVFQRTEKLCIRCRVISEDRIVLIKIGLQIHVWAIVARQVTDKPLRNPPP